MIIANDIGSKKYKQKPDYNDVIIVSKDKVNQSGWKKKTQIAKFIKKNIEKKFNEQN